MVDLDLLLGNLMKSSNLIDFINRSKNDTTKCDENNSTIHHDCIVEDDNAELFTSLCPSSLIFTLMKVIATEPKLLDDLAKDAVASYFKTHQVKAKNLITIDNLTILSRSKTQMMTWLKYEILLIHLIKEQIYEPKTMANETLNIVKSEMSPEITSKFSSVLNTCVKHCRESNRHNIDEEEEEKWCEIIDWMSWFIVTEEDSFT